jgi:hypothetical protein
MALTKIIIDNLTNYIIAIDATPLLPTEYEIDADIEGLRKTLSQPISIPKLVNGKSIYLLPQPDKTQILSENRQVKSLDITPFPVLVPKRIPLLDPVTNQQKTYEVTQQIELEDGSFETRGTGQFLPLWTVGEEQEVDEEGNPLYWVTETIEHQVVEPVPPIEIDQDHPDWNEDLEQVYETIPAGTVVEFMDYPTLFTLQDIHNHPSLDAVKQRKIDELWDICNKEILSGFTSSALGVAHSYGFDAMDQDNLTGTASGIGMGIITGTIVWKTKDAGPLPHTINQFKQVCGDAFIMKQSKINKYWTIKNQILSCTSRDDINAVAW